MNKVWSESEGISTNNMQAMENAWNEAELIHKSNLANLDPAFQ